MEAFAAPPALVAQWIEQEFPKLCAGSSILPGGAPLSVFAMEHSP